MYIVEPLQISPVALWDGSEPAEAEVAKTPPTGIVVEEGRIVIETTEETVVAAVVAELTWPEATELLPLDEEPDPVSVEAQVVSPPIPLTAAQVPTMLSELSVTVILLVTSGPGQGKTTSLPAPLVQPLATLATKRSGRDLNAVAGVVPEPEVISTAAQFM